MKQLMSCMLFNHLKMKSTSSNLCVRIFRCSNSFGIRSLSTTSRNYTENIDSATSKEVKLETGEKTNKTSATEELELTDSFLDSMFTEAESKPAEPTDEYALPKPFLDSRFAEVQSNLSPGDVYSHVQETVFRERASTDEDAVNWSDKFPALAPFDAYKVPFPLRMGKRQKLCVQPDKYGNLELLKIQNFLHLTPPAIKKQCAALQKFCTKFPEDLRTDEACEAEFPVDVHTVDYVAASKNPRDMRSRTVEKKIRLCHLVMDSHARSKMLQLAGDKRYDRRTDILTIKSNRCPLRQQNMDYTDYLLTALYFESWKTESWEMVENVHNDGSEQVYWWNSSKSYNNLKRIVEAQKKSTEMLTESPQVRDYCEAVTAIKLEPEPFEKYKYSPERKELVDNYRTSVMELLGLTSIDSSPQAAKSQ